RLVVSSGKTLVLWNANTAREIARFDMHEQRINTFSVSGDGRYAVTGTGYYEYDKDGKIVTKGGQYQYVDCTLRLLDLQSGEMLKEVKKLKYPVSNLSYTPDGKQIACSLWQANTRLWDVSRDGFKEKEELNTTAVNAYLHVFSPDGERLATSGSGY